MTQPFGPRIVAFALSSLICGSCMAEKLTLERLFAAPDISGPSLRAAHFSPDGKRVAYLRGKADDKDRFDLWAYDVATGKHALLVDSAVLDPEQHALSAEEAQRRERQRTAALGGIVEYEFSPDSRRLLVPVGGDLYLYDLHASPAKAVQRLTQTESYETDAHFSPRGHYVSFIRDQNLVILEIATGKEIAMTREGGGLVSFAMAEFIAQEEMGRSTGYWWSPDEKRIAYTRVDESPVPEVERFEIYADSVKVIKQRYPAAGARNAEVSLFIASVGGAAATRVDLGADLDFYLARVDWLPDGSALTVQKQSRDQKTLSLLETDTTTGATHELLTERSDTWVDLHDELTFLKRSPQFIWASSRSGHKHLYLYDLDGKLLRQITQGEWEVVADGGQRAIKGIDERRRLIYFMANERTPLERHLYVTSLDAPAVPAKPAASTALAGVKQVTSGAGWHYVAMSDDTQQFLDTFSTPEHPPSITLRSSSGAVRAMLVANELTPDHPYARYLPDHVSKEFGTLQARDGQTLHYQMLKPRDIAPGQRYPVMLDVYGGPGVQIVKRAWGKEELFHQYLVQHGYIVFTLDNRGSTARGVKFETAIYHRMSSVEVEDQVTGVRWLKSQPFVDPQRVGVFGWSYGGYMALMCMMKAPNEFAAGVAGAPVTDWRLYDTHYTERYMGKPSENPEGYAIGDVLSQAASLRAPLLIMHGMADDNVLFTHSTALFKKLQDLNKPFEVMPYPGSKHGLLRNTETGLHGYTTIVRFLDEHLKAPAH
jgi:dipeptidyl-peptidase-4